MADVIEHGRFKDAPWYETAIHTKIIIGGAGGIGSWLTLLLARAGLHCYVLDDDMVEQHNMAGQLYGKGHVSMPKVHALKELVWELVSGETKLNVIKAKIDENTKVGTIVASAFDNMLARKHLFEAWCRANVTESTDLGESTRRAIVKAGALYIDGRLEAENMMIFCITNEAGIIDYRKELELTDADIEEATCTFKQTSYAAAMIASHMTGFIVNHLTNVAKGRAVRKVPYRWEYFIPLSTIGQFFEGETYANIVS